MAGTAGLDCRALHQCGRARPAGRAADPACDEPGLHDIALDSATARPQFLGDQDIRRAQSPPAAALPVDAAAGSQRCGNHRLGDQGDRQSRRRCARNHIAGLSDLHGDCDGGKSRVDLQLRVACHAPAPPGDPVPEPSGRSSSRSCRFPTVGARHHTMPLPNLALSAPLPGPRPQQCSLGKGKSRNQLSAEKRPRGAQPITGWSDPPNAGHGQAQALPRAVFLAHRAEIQGAPVQQHLVNHHEQANRPRSATVSPSSSGRARSSAIAGETPPPPAHARSPPPAGQPSPPGPGRTDASAGQWR